MSNSVIPPSAKASKFLSQPSLVEVYLGRWLDESLQMSWLKPFHSFNEVVSGIRLSFTFWPMFFLGGGSCTWNSLSVKINITIPAADLLGIHGILALQAKWGTQVVRAALQCSFFWPPGRIYLNRWGKENLMQYFLFGIPLKTTSWKSTLFWSMSLCSKRLQNIFHISIRLYFLRHNFLHISRIHMNTVNYIYTTPPKFNLAFKKLTIPKSKQSSNHHFSADFMLNFRPVIGSTPSATKSGTHHQSPVLSCSRLSHKWRTSNAQGCLERKGKGLVSS